MIVIVWKETSGIWKWQHDWTHKIDLKPLEVTLQANCNFILQYQDPDNKLRMNFVILKIFQVSWKGRDGRTVWSLKLKLTELRCASWAALMSLSTVVNVEDTQHMDIKKPKKGEVNTLPHYPEGVGWPQPGMSSARPCQWNAEDKVKWASRNKWMWPFFFRENKLVEIRPQLPILWNKGLHFTLKARFCIIVLSIHKKWSSLCDPNCFLTCRFSFDHKLAY